jgi:hypothetical protein
VANADGFSFECPRCCEASGNAYKFTVAAAADVAAVKSEVVKAVASVVVDAADAAAPVAAVADADAAANVEPDTDMLT